MPFQIRNKITKEIVSVRSGKTVWTTAGHAKAAFKTSGLSRWGTGKGTYEYHGIPKGCRFDDQDKLEIIEVTVQGDNPRFCFMRDDDCHNYMIPVSMREEFSNLLDGTYDDDICAEFNNKFEQYRCDSTSNWSFELPKEDQ